MGFINTTALVTAIIAVVPASSFAPSVRNNAAVGKLCMVTSGQEKIQTKKSDFQVVDPL
jgi:hypothetical protein